MPEEWDPQRFVRYSRHVLFQVARALALPARITRKDPRRIWDRRTERNRLKALIDAGESEEE